MGGETRIRIAGISKTFPWRVNLISIKGHQQSAGDGAMLGTRLTTGLSGLFLVTAILFALQTLSSLRIFPL